MDSVRRRLGRGRLGLKSMKMMIFFHRDHSDVVDDIVCEEVGNELANGCGKKTCSLRGR